ncbi:MAG: phosphatase PAP2 family protein [Polyangiaceae bacterium]
MRASLALGPLLVSVTWASAAVAEPLEAPEPGPAYQLHAGIDVPAVAIPAVISASWLLGGELEPPYCAPRCDPDGLNFIDRPAAGLHSEAWSGLGNVATLSTLVSMPFMLFMGEKPSHALNDVVVVIEATLWASATQVVVSYATARPRPRLYGDEAPDEDRFTGTAARSFFSGHSATGWAATVSTFRTLLRTGHPAMGWAALAVGGTGSTVLSVARIGAGSHFPTDVVAGTVVGISYGFLVPALHSAPVASTSTARAPRLTLRPYPMIASEMAGAGLLGTF